METQLAEKNRVIGVARDYSSLMDLLAARRRELKLTQLAADELSGLQSGYVGKLECGAKGLWVTSMAGILHGLGLELQVVRRRPSQESFKDKSDPSVENLKKHLKKLGAQGGRARVRNQTPEERRASARNAARARWKYWRAIKAEQLAKAKRAATKGNAG